MDTEWTTIRGTLMTDHAIPAYGGIRIPVAMLEELAQSLNQAPLPFHANHELSRPLRVRGTRAWVAARDDGFSELACEAEMHPDDIPLVERMRGMSATLMTPLDGHPVRDTGAGGIRLAADYGWFSDDALIEAERALVAVGVPAARIEVKRAFQFGAIPAAQIYLEIGLPLLISISSAVLWDGIKSLWRRRRTPNGGDPSSATTVNVVVEDGDRRVTAVVTTDDEDVAMRAIQALGGALRPGAPTDSGSGTDSKTVVWNDSEHGWAPPG